MTTAQLQAEQITAMKSKDTLRLQVIREILAQIKNKEIAIGRELSEEEITTVIQKIKKEALESIDSFTKGKRNDLVEETQKQLHIIVSFLPPELTNEQLQQTIQVILNTNTLVIAKNPKAAIGLCMKELRGKADSARIMEMRTKMQPS